MHHSMQERVDGLAELRQRSAIVTAEFFARIGRLVPARPPRYQAISKGKAWHIREVSTGRVCGFRFSYKAAMRLLETMESRKHVRSSQDH